MRKFLDKFKNENGVVIVEATIIFPFVFFVLFFLIYYGSARYEKAKVDSYVMQSAILGAQCSKDPYQYDMYKDPNKGIPTTYRNCEPYRYFIGGMDDVENKISADVVNYINDTSSTFFVGMNPQLKTSQDKIAKFNNYLVYSTFSVEISYEVEFPIKFLGSDTPTILEWNSRAEVSVNDAPEFIRNIDMVQDLFERTAAGDKIKSAFNKINSFIGKFSK